jgi:adenylosuccinate synthase
MKDSAEKRIMHLYGDELEFNGTTSEEEYRTKVSKLSRYSGDAADYLHKALNDGKRVLFEGAQGTLLDIDHGTYPFVTSSNCISAAASTGTGIAINKIDAVLGITKAYTTRVGTGPFPTELRNELGMTIAERGKEFGTVTGRPRRCGWLDLVALRYAVRINGSEHLAVTKLDVLNGLAKVKVCVAYDLDGTEISSFPSSSTALDSVSPVYEELDGWKDIELVLYEELPGSLREYLSKIESFTESKIAILSVGPDRNETIATPKNSIIDA